MGYTKALTHFGADEAELEIEVDSNGGLTPSDFNSTRFPGVCKPTNQRALDKIMEYQRQMNRLAHSKGFAKIAVDGDVGPATLQLLAKVSPANAGQTCLNAAISADMMTPVFKAQADAAGVSATVAGPRPASVPTYITPSGVIKPSATAGAAGSLIDTVNQMSTGQKMLAAALLGGIGYFGYKELKKGKK